MEISPAHLMSRLDSIAQVLQGDERAMALIGLGSVGVETSRLDAYSGLNFIVVVGAGCKTKFLAELIWLSAAYPLLWNFRNSVDGYKALMADGVFCEFSVFETDTLGDVQFSQGRCVWRRASVPENIATPRNPVPINRIPSEEWIVGEALSCVFVGMQHWHRGEKLSAFRLIQVHALDRLIELEVLNNLTIHSAHVDPCSRARRIEQRHPVLSAELNELAPGYANTPDAALAILAALERRGAQLNPLMVTHIRRMSKRSLPHSVQQ